MENIIKNNVLNRESNMELLRIVSMSMIVVYHFLVHGIFGDNFHSVMFRVLFPFVSCGVNLFFLLSGYFKIKLSVPSLLKLVMITIVFRFVDLTAYVIGGGYS